MAMTDVLRVHAWKYVKGVREACAAAPEDGGTRNIDSDTAVSRGSFRAALKAAGSICAAVDDVVAGRVLTPSMPQFQCSCSVDALEKCFLRVIILAFFSGVGCSFLELQPKR